MKKTLWWVGGFCAAAAGFLVLGARRVQPVEALAQEPEAAWTDDPDGDRRESLRFCRREWNFGASGLAYGTVWMEQEGHRAAQQSGIAASAGAAYRYI